jgi:hypothetical protein
MISEFLELGLASEKGGRIALTPEGFLKSNAIIGKIIRVIKGQQIGHS